MKRWPKSPRIVFKCATSTYHGPNHLGLWSNAPPRHNMAQITSGCVQMRPLDIKWPQPARIVAQLASETALVLSAPHLTSCITSPHLMQAHLMHHLITHRHLSSPHGHASPHRIISPHTIAYPPDIVTEHHFMHHLISPQLTTSPHLTSCMQVCGVLPAKR